MDIWAEADWLLRRAAHEARVDRWTAPHLKRRRRGVAHPVEDFLFTYYSFRPAQLQRWHPGFGITLAGPSAREYLRSDGYVETPRGVSLSDGMVVEYGRRIRWVRDLLVAVQNRPPSFGCFGMHEWAMVYRHPREEIRHAAWPLRLSPAETNAVVERHQIRCTHFDAFRFFTEPARPHNVLQPERETRVALEQGGCLHATMDAYKWAYQLSPLVPSELVADCFALAREVRAVDMRASPYDLTSLGYEPIRIETSEGKATYVSYQRDFARRGAVLRDRLIGACDGLLDVRLAATS